MTFDGEVGGGYAGDIAIDDIQVHTGFCNQTVATTTMMPGTTVTYGKINVTFSYTLKDTAL